MKKLLVALVLALTPGCATPTPAQLAPAMMASTVALSTAAGEAFCSGVAISATRVLTAAHCLRAPIPMIYVFTEADSKPAATAVVWVDDQRDVALIEVAGANFTPARLGDSDKLQRGDRVFATGNPRGILHFSFSPGHVAYVGRKLGDFPGTFIQYHLETRGGSSGGPVFNEYGEVIAINVRGDSAGISFGVPINEAKR